MMYAVWFVTSLLVMMDLSHAANVCEEYFDLNFTGNKEWRLAFRGTPGVGTSVFDAYYDGTGIPTTIDPGCRQISNTASCTHHYRNDDVLDNWANIDQVAFVVFKDNAKVHQVVFDGDGTDYLNWFRQNKIEESTWTDLTTATQNHFSIEGDASIYRRFFINGNYGGCPSDNGWFVAIDNVSPPCSWEPTATIPTFLYGKGDTMVNWTTGDVGEADVIAVFVKY